MNNNFDVAVVGGGVSGVCAAIIAARRGLRTVLIEKNSFLGGTPVLGMFSFICGLFFNDNNKNFLLLNHGITKEILNKLSGNNFRKCCEKIGKTELFSMRSESLVPVLKCLVENEKNLTTLYLSNFKNVKLNDNKISSIIISQKSVLTELFVNSVVDATGCGAIILKSGAEYLLNKKIDRQLNGYSFKIKKIKKADKLLQIKIPYLVSQAVKKNLLPNECRFTTVTIDEVKGTAVIKISLVDAGKDKATNLIFDLIKSNFDEFKCAEIDKCSDEILEREGVRLKGLYILNETDVKNCKKFDDGIVNAAWPIEFWSRDKGPKLEYLKPGSYYQIPARCLKSKNIKNLFATGRCISADAKALASSRMVGTCMALGEAVGKLIFVFLCVFSCL